MVCKQCGFANQKDTKFCTACGAALAVVCGHCGETHDAGASFCGSCGNPGANSPHSRASQVRLPGSFCSGRYKVLGLLGSGGSKTVYLVHDQDLNRDVAFAIIKTRYADEASSEAARG